MNVRYSVLNEENVAYRKGMQRHRERGREKCNSIATCYMSQEHTNEHKGRKEWQSSATYYNAAI